MNKKSNKIWAKTTSFFLIFFSLFTLFQFRGNSTAYASFLDVGVSPREMGMGEAGISLADDVHACYYNPAGLCQLKNPQIGLNYTALYPGLDYLNNNGLGFLSYAHPLKFGALGASWRQLFVSNLYSENSFLLSYSFPILGKKIFLGSNLSLLQLNYGKAEWGMDENYNWSQDIQDPVFASGTSAFGFGIDFGLLYKYNPYFSLGVLLKNINQPSVSLKDKNIIPMTFGIGTCFRIIQKPVKGFSSLTEPTSADEFKILTDFQYQERDYQINFGVESSLLNQRLAIRAGGQHGSRSLLNVSCGASYGFPFPFLGEYCRIDYAFRLPLNELQSRFGTHRVGMVISFGEAKRRMEQKKKFEQEKKRKQEEEARIKALEEAKLRTEEEAKKKEEARLKLEEEVKKKEEEKSKLEQLRLEAEKAKEEVEKARLALEEEKKKFEEVKRARTKMELEEKLKGAIVRETEEGIRINLRHLVKFEVKSAILDYMAFEVLDQIIEILEANPEIKMKIEGHTDSRGGRQTNLRLSKERAEQVAKYFISQGIPEERIISATGYGPDKPIANNKTKEGRAQNRRTEIIILK